MIELFILCVACVVIVILQRQMCAEIVKRIEADRDVARNEAKVYREILLPALRKVEAASGSAPTGTSSAVLQSGQTVPTPSALPKAAASGKRPLRRVPFRIRFNELRKKLNTPQQKTDAMAEAIERTALQKATIQKAKAFIEEQQHVSENR